MRNTFELRPSADTFQTNKLPREYAEPTVVQLLNNGKPHGFAIFGTAYGYLHNCAGDMRTFYSRSAAYRAKKAYQPF